MIVLFGGNGFIGRHVAVAAEGRVPVTIVARREDEAFLSDHAPSARFMRLEDFLAQAGDELLRTARAFVYLANTSIPASNLTSPWLETSDNVAPAFRAFMRAVEANPAIRLLFPSSGGTVYGQGHSCPISETSTVAPISPYGLAKVMTEEALHYVGRCYGADYGILRISNPAGKWHRNRGQGLLEVAVRKALAGEPLTIFGDGSNMRDYFDADDLAEAILTVISYDAPLAGVWNVGSGEGRSIVQVCDEVVETLGRPLELRFEPPRNSDVGYAVLDVEKIANDFSWRGTTSMAQTIIKIGRDSPLISARRMASS